MTWQAVALGELTEKIGSGSTPQGGNESYKPSGIPLIRSMNIHDGLFKPDGLVFLDETQARTLDHVILAENDVLLNITGASVARVCRLPSRYAGGRVNQHVAIVRPRPDKLDPDYLAQCLISPSIKHELLRVAGAGATREAITKARIQQFEIPLPPLEEQRRIAAILDQADDLRRKRRWTLERLNRLGGAIFSELFGNPRTNPLRFKFAKLGEIVNFVGGSQPPKSNFLYEDGPNRVRFVQIRDFTRDDYKTYIPTSLAKRPFDKDDVMIGRYGPPVFQIFRGLSGSYNVALMKAEPGPGILKDFVYYLLQEDGLHNFVVANSERTAGQSGVNLTLLEAYPAYAPPLELQQAFAARVTETDQLKAHHRAHLAKLDALFASLQHRAFRGEL